MYDNCQSKLQHDFPRTTKTDYKFSKLNACQTDLNTTGGLTTNVIFVLGGRITNRDFIASNVCIFKALAVLHL